MNNSDKEFFDELMEQVSLIEKSRNEDGGCDRPGSGGDCLHYIGFPEQTISEQHDGAEYGKPNGWCWSCWKSLQINNLLKKVRGLEIWESVAEQRLPIDKMSASEALYGFMGWLTARNGAVTFPGHHSGEAADLVPLFCEVNNLAKPRSGWNKKLVHPKECRPDESTEMREVTEEYPPSWRPYLEQILSKLSGNLSHDNIATAKLSLKKMLDTMSHV